VVAEAVTVERGCCPFFVIEWDVGPRRLTIAVTDPADAPALEAIAEALGLTDPPS
jgi:hypothetical protein